MPYEMTPLERTLAALSFKEVDRVPVFLLLTMHGAKLLRLPLRQYLCKGESLAKGQLRLRELLGHDCLYNMSYAAAQAEAFGAEVSFFRDGPPNVGRPSIMAVQEIDALEPPEIPRCRPLQETIRATSLLHMVAEGEVPIIGVVVSPFSLPIMQMGFAAYLDLIHEDRGRFWSLMRVNQEFCVEWANRQLEAGATTVVYFDPMASSSILPRPLYLETGFRVARETLPRIRSPCPTHLGSGRCLGVARDIAETGSVGLGVSALEDIGEVKRECAGRMAVVGNLNGIEMVRWTRKRASESVRDAIARAAPGGGFILSDNHGEIPFQVPWGVLGWVMDAALRFGESG